MTLRTTPAAVFRAPSTRAAAVQDVAQMTPVPTSTKPALRTDTQLAQAVRALIDRQANLRDVFSVSGGQVFPPDELREEKRGGSF